MIVEVWRPDGIEATSYGSLLELVQAENGPQVGLLSHDKGARVWLEPEEIEWLTDQLKRLENGTHVITVKGVQRG